jgi:DNA-binding transcriptional regulator YhcF (GntR family)
MSTWKESFPKSKPFKCCAAWHLWKSGQALAVYDFLGGITSGGKGEFFSSIRQVAIFFGMNYEATRRVFKVLRKLGFIELLTEGKFSYVSHEEWAEKNPGKCAARELLPWQECSDPFVGKIWQIAGGKLRVLDWQVAAIRKHVGEESFLLEFEQQINESVKKRIPGGDWRGTASKAIFWQVYNRLKGTAPTVDTHAHK